MAVGELKTRGSNKKYAIFKYFGNRDAVTF